MAFAIPRSGRQRVLAAACLVILFSSMGVPRGASADDRAAPAQVTFALVTVPHSADEIPNPMRGGHAWYHSWSHPTTWPIMDEYERFRWRDLEPTRGAYQFGTIDSLLAYAARQGGNKFRGKLGFRIMAADPAATSVPDYIVQAGAGYQFGDAFVPDFNSRLFMDRAQALIRALGQRYNNDPRLGWVEIGFMGMWGEWHVFNAPVYERGALGANQAWSVANAQRIVDWHRQYFSNKRLIMLTADFPALDYALSADPRIGWRHDCLGDETLDGGLRGNYGFQKHADRWRTAPVLWERCGNGISAELSRDQVLRYRMSAGHDLNQPAWDHLSAAERTLQIDTHKMAGYRFQVSRVTAPISVAPGDSFTIVSQWSNVNLTPAYSPWTVKIQLRNPSTGRVAWEGRSRVDLEKLMPTVDRPGGVDSPIDHTDRFVLGPIPRGEYRLTLLISDPSGYYDPLRLANAGRAADGSYALGTFRVS